MSVAVAPASRGQIADWLRLREALYSGLDRDFHLQEIEKFLTPGQAMQCLLAIDERADDASQRRAVGIVELSLRNVVDGCLSSPVGYIEGIYVEPDCRGQGIGQALFRCGEAWLRSQGCVEVATEAELNNVSAQRFHLRMGFAETYRIVEYRKALSRGVAEPV